MASGDKGEVVIKISGDPEEFFEAMGLTKKSAENLNENLKNVSKAAAAAFAAFTGEILLSAHAFEESDKAARALTQSLQNQGIYSDALLESYKQQASELQHLTGVDDDAIIKNQALLQGFLGNTEITKELTKAVLDLAEGSGKDLTTAFELVGKAAQGHTAGLQKLGITVDENGSKQQILAEIVEKVNGRFKDQATAANQGLGGLRGLSAAFSDLQEDIGAHFAPVLGQAIKLLTSLFETAKKHEGLISFLAGAIAAGAAISGLVAAIAGGIVAFASISTAAATLGIALTPLLGPIGLIIAGVAALAGGIAYLSTRTAEAKEPLSDLRDQIKKSIVTIGDLQEKLNNAKSAGFDKSAAIVQKQIDDEKAKITELEAAYRKLAIAKKNNGQDPAAQAAAEKAQAEEKAAFERRRQLQIAQNELALLESQRGSKELIDLKKKEVETLTKIQDDKYKESRAALKENLDEIRKLETQAAADSVQRQSSLQTDILAKDRQFQALNAEQKKAFLRKYEQEFQASLDTQRTAEEKAVKESIQRDIDRQNALLKNKQKFGDALGTIESTFGLNIFLDVGKGAQGAADAITKIAGTIADTIVPGLGGFVSGVLSFLAQGPEKVKEMVSSFVAAIPGVITTIVSSIPAIFEGLQAGLLSLFGDLDTLLPAFIQKMLDGASAFITGILSSLPDIALGLLDGAIQAITAIVERAPQVISKLVEDAPKIIATLVEKVPDIITKLIFELPRLIQELAIQLPYLIQVLGSLMPRIAFELTAALIKEAPNILKGFLEEMLKLPEKIFEQIKQVFNVGGNIVKDIGKALGFAEGGVVPGSGTGDTVPIMATPGELIVPPQNFDEVVSAVAASRSGGGAGAGGSQEIHVTTAIGFDGREASQVLTARQIEDRALGISREAAFA